MDVELPDGTVIEGVPEGTTQAELMRRYKLSASGAAAAPPTQQAQDAKAYAGAFAGGGEVKDMGNVSRFLGGAKTAWDRAALGLKGITPEWLGGGLTDEDKQLLAQGRAFEAEGGKSAFAGNVLGNVAITAPAGGMATQALRIGTGALPATIGALTRGAGQVATGAGLGALTEPENRARGATFGALGSAAGMGVSRLVGGMVRPLVSQEARALQAAGVQPTIGQAVGGAVNKAEEVATSMPFVGSAIRNARNRAINEFNEAAIQTAAPGVRGFGDDAVMAARDAISQQYQRALGAMPQSFRVDAAPIIQTAIQAADDPALALTHASQARVLDYVERNLLQRANQLSPEVAKRVESDLGQAVNRLLTSSNAEDRAVGAALRQVQEGWRNSLTGVANMAGQGGALREADAAWRAFLPVDKAASSAIAQSSEEAAGRFTPRVLRRSIEALDKSANNRATRAAITGNTPFDRLNALTRAGQTLGNTVPDSGTAGRLMQAAATGAAVTSPERAAIGAGAWLGSQALYSRLGQRFAMEGLEPAARFLMGNGATADQVTRFVSQHGPQALLNLARSAATDPQAMSVLAGDDLPMAATQ